MEFTHDVGAVSLDGVNADDQGSCRFFVAFALGKDLQDFPLPRSQPPGLIRLAGARKADDRALAISG